ncbi:MAG TPA: cytochrome c oxidase subunit II [Longimicrobiaceae bacterium]|nr:cytochrome c oxidase subunit II [Longimicrobiaceae bacterium]
MRPALRTRVATLAAAPLLLAGCAERAQSALDPAGAQAERIHHLMAVSVWIAGPIAVAVTAAVVWAALRRRDAAHVPGTPAADRRIATLVAALTGVTVVVLFGWMMADFFTIRSLTRLDGDPLRITLVGHQWWWEVQYHDSVPARQMTTANEIHIPVGRPVLLTLQSRDVIHSFWVPRLHGKRDLIPGYVNRIWLRADRPGTFRGQCAEFCGQQHAKMALWVVAEPPARYAAWYAAQLRPAEAPADSTRAAGQKAFLGGACVMCHSIRGTPSGGRNGPDLTHLGSRRTLAAGTLPNTPGHLAGWVADPQSVKPGTQMPPSQLRPDELRALVAYLEGLR